MKPIAQTFTVNPLKYNKGLFLTSVDLFFSDKPHDSAADPVMVALHSVDNGIPQPINMPGSNVFLGADSCSIPSVGDSTDIAAIRLANTTFTFPEPVYLSPGKMYAIVAYSNDRKYRLYASRNYDFVVGTTEQRAAKITGLNNLFTSTNGAIWEPDPTMDLMMKLNKAVFTPNAIYEGYLENAEPGYKLLQSNPILTDSGSTTITILDANHGFGYNDYVTIYGLDSATTYNGMLGTSILGERQISAVDHTGYQITADSSATSSLRTGGDAVIVTKQVMMDEYSVNLAKLTPTGTNVVTSVKLTSGASYAGNRNLSTNSSYAVDATFRTIMTDEYLYASSPELIASVKNETAHNSGTKSVQLKLEMSTSDSNVSPIIDLQRADISSVENIIDRQDSAATSNFNVPLSFVSETDPQDGTSASKHITKPITLAETAVGLKILLAANRPNTADFEVYFRTSTSDELITDKPWSEVSKEAIIAPDEDPTIFREYTYIAGGIGGNLTPFSTFQLKIVMTSTNSSKVPRIKDLRAIALAV